MHFIYKEEAVGCLWGRRAQCETTQHTDRSDDHENQNMCQRGQRQRNRQSKAQFEQISTIEYAKRQTFVRDSVIVTIEDLGNTKMVEFGQVLILSLKKCRRGTKSDFDFPTAVAPFVS